MKRNFAQLKQRNIIECREGQTVIFFLSKSPKYKLIFSMNYNHNHTVFLVCQARPNQIYCMKILSWVEVKLLLFISHLYHLTRIH